MFMSHVMIMEMCLLLVLLADASFDNTVCFVITIRVRSSAK